MASEPWLLRLLLLLRRLLLQLVPALRRLQRP